MSKVAKTCAAMADYLETELSEAIEAKHADDINDPFVTMLIDPDEMRVVIANLRTLAENVKQTA